MNKRKQLIAESFDRGVENYDEHAVIQKQAAHKLITLIPHMEEPLSVLEIGCGTGYLTKILKERFPNSEIIAIDISKNMIDHCQSKINGVEFIHTDGENYNTTKKYDLIISNMTIQWFDNTAVGLNHLKTLLKPNGSLIFSGLGRDSFYEWNQVMNDNGFIKGSDQNDTTEEEKSKIQYNSGLDFLRSIKIIGANHPIKKHKRANVKNLRKACRLLEEKYDATVTWHIIYGHHQNRV